MAIVETSEIWVRIDLFCDGVGDDGICVLSACNEKDRLSDVAPTAEGARNAIFNASVKSCWRFDPTLQRWLCSECVRVRDASERPEVVAMTDSPPSVPTKRRRRFRGGTLTAAPVESPRLCCSA
jgi:hypothetical protein